MIILYMSPKFWVTKICISLEINRMLYNMLYNVQKDNLSITKQFLSVAYWQQREIG